MRNPQTDDFNLLYYFVESTRFQFSPIRISLLCAQSILNNPLNYYSRTAAGKYTKAAVEIFERITRKYDKPEFGIQEVVCEDNKKYHIKQVVSSAKPFCYLMHFQKIDCKLNLPKLIIVAPMAGHHATLLRGTVKELLPFFDVYITDWIDASFVPKLYGKFDLDDYINYMIDFFNHFDEPPHVLAVCQPTVPVLAATAITTQYNLGIIPKTLTLIGGPIDARKNPTEINDFVTNHKLEWFKHNVITHVPPNYPGSGRKVYPGFLQLAGFMSMNWQKHLKSHVELFKNIVSEDNEHEMAHKVFYDEYLSVMDLPSEFYLQTITEVFQKFSLARGKMVSDGRHVDVSCIKNCAILGIEGERDDIAAVGQTRAALSLCKGIPSENKHYHMQPGVGHYGVFSGSKFKAYVVPVIKKFISQYS